MYIPERFIKTVTLHILKNQFSENSLRVPLLLGIHGKPGDGKTFQCEQVLKHLGVKTLLISGGQLESQDAGEPAQLIRKTYLEASECITDKQCQAAAILINDIDTGLGEWGDLVQYTVNRQTALGELMHLVDYPYQVENKRTKRIPIIMTGNDFSKLYEPLVRAGRMTSFFWQPTLGEKAIMVRHIFTHLTQDESYSLVETLQKIANSELTIAFFAHLNSTLYDAALWSSFGTLPLPQILPEFFKERLPSFNNKLSLDELIEHGERLIQSGQLVNHLRG